MYLFIESNYEDINVLDYLRLVDAIELLRTVRLFSVAYPLKSNRRRAQFTESTERNLNTAGRSSITS